MGKRIPLVVLFAILLSCSPNSESMTLFQGDPGIGDLPTNVDFNKIVGDAPLARFSILKYENRFSDILAGRTNVTDTRLVKLTAQNKNIAVTKTEYFFIHPNGSVSKQVTDVDVGVPGIVSFVHLTTKYQSPQQIQFRKKAQRLDDLNGRLFPLKIGRQLSFNLLFAYQTIQGRKSSTAIDQNWSYKFRIVGQYVGYPLLNRAIPGNVYVIDRQERDPEGYTDNTLIHFAESIGAVVKIVRQVDNNVEETRLISLTE